MLNALEQRCQRIEEAAVPTGTVEELRGLCDRNDQDLKAHIDRFHQEVTAQHTGLQGALKKAEDAFMEISRLSARQQQVQQSQMGMIAQEVEKQSGIQVQATLHILEQEAATARQGLEGLRSWMGGQ